MMLCRSLMLSPLVARSIKLQKLIIFQHFSNLSCINTFSASSRCNFLQGFNFDKAAIIADWKRGVKDSELSINAKKIHLAHLNAVNDKQEVYTDPLTGYEVFTMIAHLNRGACCGNACRHCPFQHVMVPTKERHKKVYNSAFYV